MYTSSMATSQRPTLQGRGATVSPPNRFEAVRVEDDFADVEHDEQFACSLTTVATQYLPDQTQSIISQNNSPDIPFRYSINPYRGCQHGCAYCYARPTHEYLGLNAGIDFESKILVKHRAPKLLREWLRRPKWKPETIVFSGVTDCYQPIERQLELTRGCLEVALEARQPIGMITKNALIRRDIDLLSKMAKHHTISVSLSITSLDQSLTRVLEPRTSAPAARLKAISALSDAGVPTNVMVAPIIPGLNDDEVPAILAAAKEAGAMSAGYTLLRLPLAVKPVFLDWLERHRPLAKDRIESLIASTREGKLNDSRFGNRMRGTGPIAEQIRQSFDVFRRKHGLAQPLPPLDATKFRKPVLDRSQLRLFDDE